MSTDPALLQIQIDKLSRDLVQARKDIDSLSVSLRECREAVRPGVDELKRRATLESEVMEALSHQRHRIDKWDKALSETAYVTNRLGHEPLWPWKVALWRLIEKQLTNSTLRRWVGRKLLD